MTALHPLAERTRALLALLAAGWSGAALAGPVDIYGFDSRAMGRGGGGLVLADGPGDLFRNPALLERLPAAQASIGYSMQRGDFKAFPAVYWDTNRDGVIDGNDPPLHVRSDMDPADGVMFGLSRPVGGRFGLGVAAYVPKDRLLRIDTFDASLPNWFMYANRAHRYELMAGFGWEQIPGLSIGGAVEMVTRVRMKIDLTLDVGVRGAEEGDSGAGDLIDELAIDVHKLEVDLVPSFAPVASFAWDMGKLIPALDGLNLGASYRGSSGLPVDVEVDLQANVEVSDLGELEPLIIAILVPVRLDIFDHYVPDRLSVGIAWDKGPSRVYFDLHRTWWNRMKVNVVTAQGSVETELFELADNELRDGNAYDLTLRAVTSFKAGGEVELPPIATGGDWEDLVFTLRSGGGLEPSPLVSQGTQTALVDADRIVLALGLGARHADPFELVAGPVRWDLHAALHPIASGQLQVGDTTQYREGAPLDASPIPIGGKLWSAGLQWSFDF